MSHRCAPNTAPLPRRANGPTMGGTRRVFTCAWLEVGSVSMAHLHSTHSSSCPPLSGSHPRHSD